MSSMESGSFAGRRSIITGSGILSDLRFRIGACQPDRRKRGVEKREEGRVLIFEMFYT